jgi:hypothetical protein
MDGSEAHAAATKAPSVSDLPGTYIQRWAWPNFHYIVEQGDHAPADLLGLPSSVTAQQSPTLKHGAGAYGVRNLELRVTRRLFILAAKQPYTANNVGGLSLFVPPPGSPGLHRCTPFNTDIMWSGYYHWSLLGRQLFITKVRDTPIIPVLRLEARSPGWPEPFAVPILPSRRTTNPLGITSRRPRPTTETAGASPFAKCQVTRYK